MTRQKLHTDAVSRLLRGVLDRHRLSQKELAARTGLHQSEVSRLLRPGSNATVGRLASCLWALDERLVFRVVSRGDPAGTGWCAGPPVTPACSAPETDLLLGA